MTMPENNPRRDGLYSLSLAVVWDPALADFDGWSLGHLPNPDQALGNQYLGPSVQQVDPWPNSTASTTRAPRRIQWQHRRYGLIRSRSSNQRRLELHGKLHPTLQSGLL